MPLEKSPSKAARQRNIEREIAAGKPIKQAVAIGYSVQRQTAKPKRKRKVQQRDGMAKMARDMAKGMI